MRGQDGWILAKFFFAFLWTKTKTGLNGLKITPKDFRFCRTNAGNSEQARYAHLAHSGSQLEHRIHFILPASGASHIINYITVIILQYINTLSSRYNVMWLGIFLALKLNANKYKHDYKKKFDMVQSNLNISFTSYEKQKLIF